MDMPANQVGRTLSVFRLLRSMLLAFALLAATACRAPEDENYPGYCRLSCSNTSIGASNFRFNSILFPADYSCLKGETDSWTTLAKWVVTSPIRRVDNTEVEVERPAISFSPRFGGGWYDPAYKDSGGIVTPESEWCSDSCGVATVTVSVMCPPEDDEIDFKYIVGIQSGAVVSEGVSWTVQKAK
jgi:hypothetical protein